MISIFLSVLVLVVLIFHLFLEVSLIYFSNHRFSWKRLLYPSLYFFPSKSPIGDLASGLLVSWIALLKLFWAHLQLIFLCCKQAFLHSYYWNIFPYFCKKQKAIAIALFDFWVCFNTGYILLLFITKVEFILSSLSRRTEFKLVIHTLMHKISRWNVCE